jgi:hypothetical protein
MKELHHFPYDMTGWCWSVLYLTDKMFIERTYYILEQGL